MLRIISSTQILTYFKSVYYVIAWGRLKLVFNFMRVFKVLQSCEALKTQVKLNTNFTRTDVITLIIKWAKFILYY